MNQGIGEGKKTEKKKTEEEREVKEKEQVPGTCSLTRVEGKIKKRRMRLGTHFYFIIYLFLLFFYSLSLYSVLPFFYSPIPPFLLFWLVRFLFLLSRYLLLYFFFLFFPFLLPPASLVGLLL